MDLEKLLEELSPLERAVLPHLESGTELEDVTRKSGKSEVEVMRALQWLENKGALKINRSEKQIVGLGENGKTYVKKGLPEKRFLAALSDKMSLEDVKRKAGLDENELKACIGALKSRYAIVIMSGFVEPTSKRKDILREGFPEESLLRKLPKDIQELCKEDGGIARKLLKRKDIIEMKTVKLKHVELTGLGKKLAIAAGRRKLDLAERLMPGMIKDGKWRGKKFRRYDVKASVPGINAGKRHPYSEFLDDVREKLISMGFKEMDGPTIETEFFNFDALYQPQNHSARDWSAAYRIKEPKYGSLPKGNLVKRVKAAHENGWKTGSSGWGTKWDRKTASRLMPRAHDTAISPRYLAGGVEMPGKYFTLARCYRPDVIDSTHGVEFNQLGGFVIDKGLSFKHLLGLLKDFVYEISGIKEVRFFPDYFPFTEPSVQISARHPKFGWMELAGAGVFRPELTEPLGIEEKVIAWGFGIDRLAMMALGIKDIRDMFSRDLNFLRSKEKVFQNANC